MIQWTVVLFVMHPKHAQEHEQKSLNYEIIAGMLRNSMWAVTINCEMTCPSQIRNKILFSCSAISQFMWPLITHEIKVSM